MKKRLKKFHETVKKPLHKLRRKNRGITDSVKVPMITNDTIAAHREEVLAGARKYIYPLQHSKHRIVVVSSAIFIATVVAFFAYALVSLYRFETTSTFMYRVTQIIPFPVARVEGQFVTYENYLFELRHNMHYYRSQQKLSFDTEEGRQELQEFKKQAMDKVISDTYIKQLAIKNDIAVSTQDVDKEIAIVRQQNRLGTSDRVFEDVLRDYWGWSVNDFKRSLKQQIVSRRVASKMDTDATAKASIALTELNSGADFATVAKKYSNDPTVQETGGDYGVSIAESSRDIAANIVTAIFMLEAGKVSEIIDTGYSLEIIKVLSFEGDKARAAHIQINFKDISEYVTPLKTATPPRYFLKV